MQFQSIILLAFAATAAVAMPAAEPAPAPNTPQRFGRDTANRLFGRDDCIYTRCNYPDDSPCESIGCGDCGRDGRCDSAGFSSDSSSGSDRNYNKAGGKGTKGGAGKKGKGH